MNDFLGGNRAADIAMLDKLLEQDLPETLEEKFRNMRASLSNGRRELSARQREWVKEELDKRVPVYENLVSTGVVPNKGKVAVLDVLKAENLPKRPPGRR